jgi:hypothetical protein
MTDIAGQLKSMLAANNIDPTALINQLNTVSSKLLCNGECARNQIRKALQEEWDASKRNLATAPQREHDAEKSLYVFDHTYGEYMAMLFARNTSTAAAFQKKSLTLHSDYTADLDVLLKQYATEVRLFDRMKELLMTKMVEYVQLKQKLDDGEKVASTLSRKVAYEDSNSNRLLVIQKMILFVYYGLFFAYLMFGSFFGKQQYRNKAVWWIAYCYLSAPILTADISQYLFKGMNWCLYMWRDHTPKNVYIDI